MNYKFSTTLNYQGKSYRIRANSTEALKLKKEKKLKELMDSSKVLSPDTSVDKWAETAFDTYKKNVKGLPEIKGRYYKYISPVIGPIPISLVTPVQCQNILNECTGMSFSHVDKLRQELRFIFETAKDNRLVRDNPAAKLVLPENTKGKRRSITDYEREHIRKVYDGDHKFLLYILMLECGCRPSEAMGLIGTDINHEERLLHIRGTKTANSDRYVPIPDRLYEDIKNTKPFAPVCPTSKGGQITKDIYRRMSENLKRQLNISMGCKTHRNALIPPLPLAPDFEPYCLRHTYCTDLCKAGVDIRTAQRLMGHANISITADIYTHVDVNDIIQAGEKINEYYRRAK